MNDTEPTPTRTGKSTRVITTATMSALMAGNDFVYVDPKEDADADKDETTEADR